MTKFKEIPKDIKTVNNFLDWLIPQLGDYTPEKASKVIEFFCQFVPCKAHHIINCQDCTVKALDSQKTIDEQYFALRKEVMEGKHQELSEKLKKKIRKLKGET